MVCIACHIARVCIYIYISSGELAKSIISVTAYPSLGNTGRWSTRLRPCRFLHTTGPKGVRAFSSDQAYVCIQKNGSYIHILPTSLTTIYLLHHHHHHQFRGDSGSDRRHTHPRRSKRHGILGRAISSTTTVDHAFSVLKIVLQIVS